MASVGQGTERNRRLEHIGGTASETSGVVTYSILLEYGKTGEITNDILF